MPKVTLDAEAFKVLASDTRLQILKSLDERPKTVSELGRQLNLNKATVHEHLQQLVKGDLIKKKEREGRKWVYYTLTWKGTSLLHPENTTVLILLSLGLVGSTAAVLQLGNWLRWWGMGALLGGTDEASGTEDLETESDDGQPEGAAPAAEQDSSTRSGDALAFDADPGAAAPDEGAPAEGPWWDFVEDGGFWIFALLLLVGTAALVVASVVKHKAVSRFRTGSGAVGPPLPPSTGGAA